MANAATLKKFEGDKPRSPLFAFTAELVLDTYLAGGIEVEPLLAADPDFAAKHLSLDDVVGASINMAPDAAGFATAGDYDRTNKKVALKNPALGTELAPGPIGPVTLELTLLLG